MKFSRLLATVALAMACTAAMAQVNPFVVTKTADDGSVGTLRNAINVANNSCVSVPTSPTITFNIPTTPTPGPFTIQPTSQLPLLLCPMTIDATTQCPGLAQPTPVPCTNTDFGGGNNANIQIILNGTSCPGCAGLQVSANGIVNIKGLSIVSFAGQGIGVSSGEVHVNGNYIGTDPGGMSPFPNAVGINVTGGELYAGGSSSSPADRNLITGNSGAGISTTASALDVEITNNQIGGRRDGTSGMGNGGAGLDLHDPGTNRPVTDNWIRFNGGAGVDIFGGSADIERNRIFGNGQKGISYNTAPPLAPPVITLITQSGLLTTITGTVTGPPSLIATIELFDNPNPPPVPEGQNIIGTTSATIDANGNGNFTATFSDPQLRDPGFHLKSPAARNVTATASVSPCSSVPCRETSEFSAPFVSAASPQGTLSFVPSTIAVGDSSVFKVAITNPNTSAHITGIAFDVNLPSSLPVTSRAAGSDCTGASGYTIVPSSTGNGAEVRGMDLAPGTCTIEITVSSTAAGAFTVPGSSVFIVNDAADVPASNNATLTVNAPPSLSASPTSLDFGNLDVGTSFVKDVLLTNTGGAQLTLSSITVVNSGATVFTQASSPQPCGASLSPGGACKVRVTFAPSAAATFDGSIVVTGNFGTGTATIPVTGKGIVAPPSVSPASIDFGNVPVDGSAGMPVTITNGATVAVPLAINITGTGFTVSSTCGSTLASEASCTATVTFTPTSAAGFSGTLHVTSSSSTPSTLDVPLTGTGVSGGLPIVTLSASSLTFGRQGVGTTSLAQDVTLTNTGSTPLNITSIAISGDFGYTGCGFPLTLASGTSCTFSVTFSPLANGPLTGAITIADDAAGSPHSIGLAGVGANGPQPSLSLRPFALDFGDVRVGTQHIDTITVTSNGSAPLAISSISINGPGFTQTNACPASLPVGGTCDVTVFFLPAELGQHSALLTVASNGDPASFNVALAGNGVPIPPALLAVDRLVDFGQQVIGTTSRLTLDLHNSGEQALNITALNLAGAAFALDGSCTSIAPAGTCGVTLVFTPASVDTFVGTLTILSNDVHGAIRVDLLGEGVAVPRPEIELSVDGIGFANQFITTRSAAQTVTVRSVGSAALAIRGISVTGPFELAGNTCPATLAAGASCNVSVDFVPITAGGAAGELTVDSNAAAGRGFASLTGTGCRFFSIAGLRTLQKLCR